MMGARLLFARGAMVASAIGLTSGCNLIIEPDRKQCVTNEDCTDRGGNFANTVCGASGMCEPDPTWACLDNPPPPAPEPAVYNVTIHAQNIVEQTPIAGAMVTLCRKLDDPCSDPQGGPVPTDENGDAVIQVPSNLTSYVSIVKVDETKPPDDPKQLVSAYYYFNPNVTSDMTVAVQMATIERRGQLTFVLSTPQAPDRGLILINALNCLGAAASGVVFRADLADEQTYPFYVVDGLPNITVNSTGPDGYGGFVNIVADRNVVVTAEVLETGKLVDRSSFLVRPNAITYSRLVAIGQQSPQ